MADWWGSYIRQRSSQMGLDPRAVLAVAGAEGLGGGVGDQGTSFGPFQLHVGGALPSGRGRAWAESRPGIDYALGQIQGVARGMTGRRAISNIVRRFERPANPGAEIERAASSYGAPLQAGGGGGGGGSGIGVGIGAEGVMAAPYRPPKFPMAPSATHLATSLLSAFGAPPEQRQAAVMAAQAGGSQATSNWQGQLRDTVQRALADRQAAANTPAYSGEQKALTPTGAHQGAVPSLPPEVTGGSGSLAEAFYDPLGQWDNGRYSTKGIGGHSDHVHLSVTNPQVMLAAIQQARKMGMSVRENPYTEHVDPVHVPHSFHYRDFPGTYNGRKLGQAIDVSGEQDKMAAYFRWSLANLRR